MSGKISTVGIINITNYARDEQSVIFDVCRDETGNVHIRINDGHSEIVVEIVESAAGHLGKLIYRAAFEDEAARGRAHGQDPGKAVAE